MNSKGQERKQVREEWLKEAELNQQQEKKLRELTIRFLESLEADRKEIKEQTSILLSIAVKISAKLDALS